MLAKSRAPDILMYKNILKRIFDIIISGIGILFLIPFWLILSLLIVIDDPGFVFFTQKRVGRQKKLFPILKFRTMKTKTPHDTPTHLLVNPEQYITRIGRILRKTSLDELPQLFNIFAGHMSIVGPASRPLEPIRSYCRAGQIRCERYKTGTYGTCTDKRQRRASDPRKS